MVTDSSTTSLCGLSWALRALGDLVGDVLALDHFAENGVPAGEPRRGRNRDEELAAVGVGAAVGHGQLAGLVEAVRRALGLILEAIAGAAHACARRVAALNHEVGNDAMEDGAVEELVGRLGARAGMGPFLLAFRQFDEVLHGDGCVRFEEADDDLAFSGIERGVCAGGLGHKNSLRERC